MPLLYLAKVNLNSKIFDVYNDILTFEKVFNDIYEGIKDEIIYETNEKERIMDSLGNPVQFNRNSSYSFQEISKLEEKIITGKILRTFDKPTEEVNEVTKKIEMTSVKERVSIFFYYDIQNEMITFCERQSFGYNQFMRAFANLLNISTQKYGFEIYLQKDKNLLEEKMKSFETVKRVKAMLIPPNSNEDDLDFLKQELDYMEQVHEANATHVTLDYASEKMKMDSKVMKEIMSAVSRGYGDVTATGINSSGRSITVKSSQDAAFTTNIQDNLSVIDYIEESKNMIIRFLAQKLHRHNE